MVFLIQNTQNRDSLAVQVKLSELIIAVQGAQNRLANCEELSEEELERLHAEYREAATTLDNELLERRGRKPPRLSRESQAFGRGFFGQSDWPSPSIAAMLFSVGLLTARLTGGL